MNWQKRKGKQTRERHLQYLYLTKNLYSEDTTQKKKDKQIEKDKIAQKKMKEWTVASGKHRLKQDIPTRMAKIKNTTNPPQGRQNLKTTSKLSAPWCTCQKYPLPSSVGRTCGYSG